MNSTASKMELNVEAKQIEPLTVIPGSLRPWHKHGTLAVGQVAKFRPKDADPSARWIPGQTFQVRTAGVLRTLSVERYLEPKEVPAKRIDWNYADRRGIQRHEVVHAKSYTMPGCVVVRIIRAVAV